MTTLLLTSCGPPETAPAVSEAEAAAQVHEKLFGAASQAKDITWRGSGLGIRIIVPGEGVEPKLSDTVRVHYVGRLKDGTVFDNSRTRGRPSDVALSRVIIGWAAAMPSLRPGGKAEFFIPPALGYGNMRAGNIPPGSGLIFEIELIAVNPMEPFKP